MNKKITFTELADLLSEANSLPRKSNETLLKEFFASIQETLENGENVKIRNFGMLKLVRVEARKSIHVNTGKEIEIPEHNKVVFIPEKELAEAINLPFANFETIELDDAIKEEDLNNGTENTDSQEKSVETQEPEKVTTVTKKLEEVSDSEAPIVSICPPPLPNSVGSEDNDSKNPPVIIANGQENLPDTVAEPINETQQENNQIENDESLEENADAQATTTEETIVQKPELNEIQPTQDVATDNNIPSEIEGYNYDNKRLINDPSYPTKEKCPFWKGYFWGVISGSIFVLLIMFIVTLLSGFPIIIREKAKVIETIVEQPQKKVISADTIATKPVEKVVEEPIIKDTVTETTYLTTLARKHYGNYNFWVYIYEENRNIISNPNTIKPGTEVIIPPAKKYGIDKNNPESVNAAKRKAAEIYNKYQ